MLIRTSGAALGDGSAPHMRGAGMSGADGDPGAPGTARDQARQPIAGRYLGREQAHSLTIAATCSAVAGSTTKPELQL